VCLNYTLSTDLFMCMFDLNTGTLVAHSLTPEKRVYLSRIFHYGWHIIVINATVYITTTIKRGHDLPRRYNLFKYNWYVLKLASGKYFVHCLNVFNLIIFKIKITMILLCLKWCLLFIFLTSSIFCKIIEIEIARLTRTESEKMYVFPC
jgi:hypothetical protein